MTDDYMRLLSARIPQTAASPLADLAYSVGGQQKTMPWGQQREQEFQGAMATQPPYSDWNAQFRQRYGERPNLNDPQYNYRLAYALGEQPQAYAHDPGMMHWNSAAPVAPYNEPADLKSQNHQTRWMETFMRTYGMDPHEAGAEQIQDAIRRGIIPSGQASDQALLGRLLGPGRQQP